MLDLSLDHSYVQFNNQCYFQHKGIQMGGSCSCSVANISVYEECKSIFANLREIAFIKRFLDDLFLIADVTDLQDVNEWLKSFLKHKYLEFTFTCNTEIVNFLDLEISLDNNNNINTKLYKKPMSNHQYLHYYSDHPTHLKKSLPYSQGLRILKCCNKREDRVNELNLMIEKFRIRCYPESVLIKALEKLTNVNRNELLTPKSSLLIKTLSYNNPEVLQTNMYNTIEENNDRNIIYMVFPFYNCIRTYSQIICNLFLREFNQCNNEEYKSTLNNLKLIVSFKKNNELKYYAK